MNSGKFTDLTTCPNRNIAITIGDDSAVRLWDYVNSSASKGYSRYFSAKGTCLEYNRFK